MKKLLGFFAVAAVFTLVACGDNDSTDSGTSANTTVCTMEVAGIETVTTIDVEDGYATGSTTEAREYAEGTTEEDLEFVRSMMPDELELRLDGDYIVSSYSIDFVEAHGETVPLDELIEELEAEGFTCS